MSIPLVNSIGSNEVYEKTQDQLHYKDWPNEAGFNTTWEQREPIELQVTGKLPAALAGTLLRTGPASYTVDDTTKGKFSLSHWFDGFSQVYRFQLVPQEDGTCKVLFNSRRQVDTLIEQVRQKGKLEGFTFGQKRDPCESFFQKVKSSFTQHQVGNPLEYNSGVTIHPTARSDGSDDVDGLATRTDNAGLKTIDRETLEPMGVTDQSKLHPALNGPISCAHAQFDPENGDCYNYNLNLGHSCTYRVFRTSAATGKTEILATISGSDVIPAYIHSFFLTENFVILCVWTSRFAGRGIKILWERSLLDGIAPFDPNATTTWYVVDRRNGNGLVSIFTSHAMFAFHTINAYEQPAAPKKSSSDKTSTKEVDLICDIIEFPNLDILHRFYYSNMTSVGSNVQEFNEAHQNSVRPYFGRYTLSSVPMLPPPSKPRNLLTAKACSSFKSIPATLSLKVDCPDAGELPTINPRYSTKPYRYVYSLTDRGKSSFLDGIVKTDIQNPSSGCLLWAQPKHTPGEAIFVPDPSRTDREDGGYLLSAIFDGESGQSYLLCLDAETMEEVGRAETETVVAFGFHGCHVQPSV